MYCNDVVYSSKEIAWFWNNTFCIRHLQEASIVNEKLSKKCNITHSWLNRNKHYDNIIKPLLTYLILYSVY